MEIAGSPFYIAPEVLSESYGKECDMWSLGVTIFHILTGKLPFKSKDSAKLFDKIKKGAYNTPQYLSKECNNFLSCLIKVDAR